MTESKTALTKSKVIRFLLEQTTLVSFVIILIAVYFLSDRFYTATNITNILRQSVPLGVVSMGLLFVILTGGIDLSVGSIMALVSVVVALYVPEWGLWPAVFMGLLVGTAMGAVAGGMVAWFRIAPFIATLATMTIARGIAMIISKASPVFIDSETFEYFDTGKFLAIPLTFWVLIFTAIAAYFIQKKTTFGRITMAIGSNETAVRFSGIKVTLYQFAVYGLSGLTCALAGILSSTRTGVGSPILSIGFELDAIAAVVVGGARLSGGHGTVINTLIGVAILAIISNVMNLMNISGYYQQVVKGVIIALAVMLDSLKQMSRD